VRVPGEMQIPYLYPNLITRTWLPTAETRDLKCASHFYTVFKLELTLDGGWQKTFSGPRSLPWVGLSGPLNRG